MENKPVIINKPLWPKHLEKITLSKCKVQDALRGGGFARIDVSHDADVAVLVQGDAAIFT